MSDELKDPLGEYRRMKQLSEPHQPFLGLQVFGYVVGMLFLLAIFFTSLYYLFFK